METTYFNLETRRVVYGGGAGERASGGTEGVLYACPPSREARRPGPRGQVVDLQEYRRAHTMPPVEEPLDQADIERPLRQPKRRRLQWLGLALDLLATAGILLLVAGVLLKLFAL